MCLLVLSGAQRYARLPIVAVFALLDHIRGGAGRSVLPLDRLLYHH